MRSSITSASIADHYRDLVDGLVLDEADAAQADGVDLPTLVTRTLMVTDDDKRRLAAEVLDFARRLARR
ncbi:MAG: hypothetical protein HC871_16640 [Rhizobiales bacterium]|nr:hypothetical protein [Hyphomicrobiales bacterium]